jgi:hypothetical protein
MILTLLILLAGPSTNANHWHWSMADTAREAAFASVLLVDMDQTMTNGSTCTESNPLIGTCANSKKVLMYGASCLLIHAGVAALLPKPYRAPWQYLWIGAEVNVVAVNYRAGVMVRF